jgi:hypothetical protein
MNLPWSYIEVQGAHNDARPMLDAQAADYEP